MIVRIDRAAREDRKVPWPPPQSTVDFEVSGFLVRKIQIAESF